MEEVRKRLSSFFGNAQVVPFLSGRGALNLLLQSLAFPKDSEAMLLGFTCEAVAMPVIQNKLKPVYVDIETDTFSFDMEDLLQKITPKTKVIILQHTFGIIPKHRSRVLQLAKDKKILIIEDLAHGFSPEYWQKQSLTDNEVLTLSFGRSKALSSVFGGALVTTNKRLLQQLKEIEAKLAYPSYATIARLLCYKPISFLIKLAYNIPSFGKMVHKLCNSLGLMIAEISKKEKMGFYDSYLEKKYPNALAILLLLQMKKMGDTSKQRESISKTYAKEFTNYNLEHGIPSRYPLLIERKELMLKELAKKQIYLGNWYSQPIAPVQLQLEKAGYTIGSCPKAEQVCDRIVNLPLLVTKKEAENIIAELKIQI